MAFCFPFKDEELFFDSMCIFTFMVDSQLEEILKLDYICSYILKMLVRVASNFQVLTQNWSRWTFVLNVLT